MTFSIFHKIMHYEIRMPNFKALQRASSQNNNDSQKLLPSHKVDALEKRFLVWTGKYKSVAEVPAFVGQHEMERARNRMRIKISNIMILATALGCAFMVYLGKKDAQEGKSIQQDNLNWHKKIKEDHEKEKLAFAESK
ncbi:hypothetical protein ABEB36_008271 [Hypothenemus hampei]|uniref:Uncharacterized protein n=1 Tax=Hypothenemus hampei TaxID=57062 RepID=A0ABD1ELA7_HYPHA